ncbi:hypothetical protein QCA50_014380 [Cerrena zonata]|uniref:Ubiquitin-like modifier-activating enzyme ATG7 n=1 Tax=Cerrena zonata TaxID=2478898 RepID=A0AAW0FUP7_9APHY
MPIVQFTPLSSLVEPNFWHALTNLKIDVLRLSDETVSITGSYSSGRSFVDRETGNEIALGCNIDMGGSAFSTDVQLPPNSVSASGIFKNYNTIEEFKAADKTALFNQAADEIWNSIEKGSTSSLTRFLLITFADLKKYKYYYWFAFPAFVAKPAWDVDGDWAAASTQFNNEALNTIFNTVHQPRNLSSLYVLQVPHQKPAPVEDYETFFKDVPTSARTIAFIDPSAAPSNPGWPLRIY